MHSFFRHTKIVPLACPLTYRSSLLTLMFIDLERDSAIRVQALMALAAYSVRQCSKAFRHCSHLIAALSSPLLSPRYVEPSLRVKLSLRSSYATPTLRYRYDIWHTAHDQWRGGGYGWLVCRRPQPHHSTLLFQKITHKYAKFPHICRLSF